MVSSSLQFDLTPTEEQQMTREVVQRFAREEMAAGARAADEAAELPAEFLVKVGDLGFNFMAAPEAIGGMGGGRSPVSNVLIAEDLAGGDMAMAIAALSPQSLINCVLDFGTEQQQERVANALLTSEFTPAALALMEPGIGFDVKQLKTEAQQQADGSYVMSGAKSMVAFGADARVLLVFAKTILHSGEEIGAQGFLIDSDTAGLTFEREDYMGLRPLPLYALSLNKVCVSESTRLAGDFSIDKLHSDSKIAIAALAVGCCQSVLDYVVPYVKERVAFGEPIANRQSVAFMVADMATELEAMRLMVYRAASQAEQGLDYRKMAFLAHRQCIKYAMKIASDGIQLLGGHGFIREHPVEMWYRNIRALSTLDGMLIA